MAPRNATSPTVKCDATQKQNSALQLANLRKAIPAEAFHKSLFWSVYYLLFDYGMWLCSLCAIYYLNNSEMWKEMPFWQQSIATIAFWLVSGFFMWCLFIVGHDCGHTNFSNYQLLNDIIGHITHGSLLVPYFPWQMSHHRHHMYHNHIDKDYSHPWLTPEGEAHKSRIHENFFIRLFSPVFGWFLYLFGLPDGSHFYPFAEQRLWRESDATERSKCLLSTSVCIVYYLAFYAMSGFNMLNLVYYYLVPLVVFGWWLTTVTYLQHHSPDTVVYNDADWKFVDSAFETVDRKFGFGIDTLSHHITDGHVAHHLFFTKIPHYNLPIATKAIQDYMVENNLQSMYKFEETYDFAYRVHKYFVQFGYYAPGAVTGKSVAKKSN